MKLKLLREHFQRENNKWVPKRSFDSADEIDEKEFSPVFWDRYLCGECGKFHLNKKSHRKIK